MGIFFFITCCCISCEHPVREELQISIQNRTDSFISVRLYPKAEYLSGTSYRFSDIGGGYTNVQFSLPPNNDERMEWSEIIFTTGDLNIKPYTLAAKVFDSIYISTENKDHTIKFTHENVTGYSENLFSENSTWDYKTGLQDESDFRVRRVKVHCYTFLILDDKMIIE